MKEIFDWIREQTEDWFDEAVYFPADRKVIPVRRINRIIDNAEAKWEADCCIRVIGKPFTSSCGQKYDKWTYIGEPYCSMCGKPIKISEVE